MPPTAQINIAANSKTLPTGLRQALKMVQGFVHSVTGLMNPHKSKDPDKPMTAFGSMLGGMAGQFAMRGIDKMVALGHEVFDFNDKLVRFGIAARIGGVELQNVGQAIRQVSSDTGINANEVLRGARAYVDLAGAAAYTTEKMSLIARASQASGSDINDMATVVYALQHSLSIPNTELEDTIGGLINLSKDGAVHFNQMAQELIGLAPVYAQFGITGRQGAIELASQLEVVRTGFGTASEAATGLLRIYRSLPQHAKLFKAAGVSIYEPGSKEKLRSFGALLKDIANSSLGHDRTALIKAFGRGEAERSYQLLSKLLDEYGKLEEAGHRNGVVQEDLETYTSSAAGRITQAVERMKNAFAEALTPERVDQIVSGIERIANAFPAVMDVVERIADGFASLIYLARKARDGFSGMGRYEGTPEEKALQPDYDFESGSGYEVASPNNQKWKAFQEKKKAYEDTMDMILAKESPTGITDASVMEAVADSRSTGMRPGQVAAREAAKRYLAERDVPEPVMRRVKGRIDKEEKAADSALLEQRFNDGVRDAIKDGMIAAMKSDFFRPKIMIDGNPVATATGNAPKHRTK